MNSISQATYQALRAYLGALLSVHADQAWTAIPAALHPNLVVFMTGKTEYRDEAGQRMLYAADLAAWAHDLIYGAGLALPLPLAALDVAELQAATH